MKSFEMSNSQYILTGLKILLVVINTDPTYLQILILSEQKLGSC